MHKQHNYEISIEWTGNTGTGTSGYKNYERSHRIVAKNKTDILCSADTAFRGDGTKHNPEDLLVASISSCHMLWYLHLCADAGIIVVEYVDNASGILIEPENEVGRFSEITLSPVVTVTEESMLEKAIELHKKAGEKCFITNSVNFPVRYKPSAILVA